MSPSASNSAPGLANGAEDLIQRLLRKRRENDVSLVERSAACDLVRNGYAEHPRPLSRSHARWRILECQRLIGLNLKNSKRVKVEASPYLALALRSRT